VDTAAARAEQISHIEDTKTWMSASRLSKTETLEFHVISDFADMQKEISWSILLFVYGQGAEIRSCSGSRFRDLDAGKP
jgi:hypothetical protein